MFDSHKVLQKKHFNCSTKIFSFFIFTCLNIFVCGLIVRLKNTQILKNRNMYAYVYLFVCFFCVCKRKNLKLLFFAQFFASLHTTYNNISFVIISWNKFCKQNCLFKCWLISKDFIVLELYLSLNNRFVFPTCIIA